MGFLNGGGCGELGVGARELVSEIENRDLTVEVFYGDSMIFSYVGGYFNIVVFMKHFFFLFACLMVAVVTPAQSLPQKLAEAVQILEADSTMKYAIFSLHVVDGQTGKVVYGHNSNVGLAAASTQKLFTAAAAFELLGKGYQYKTVIGYNGKVAGGVLNGDLHIKGYGDPTLGSWRWADTKPDSILGSILGILKINKISKISGRVLLNDSVFSIQPIPGGWIWDDIGNYYGAGSWGINWRENQYDLILKPGKAAGEATTIIGTKPALQEEGLLNLITTGKKGSGDNGYIYRAPYAQHGFTQGTVPPGASFTISGSLSNPSLQLSHELEVAFVTHKIKPERSSNVFIEKVMNGKKWPAMEQQIGQLLSPPLDSINYWFLRRSINLYGEALVKTLAYEKDGYGSTEGGVEAVRNFWQQQGIDKGAIHIQDGSGLSPQNRVTTGSLVQVLQYAKTRPWYSSFYNCLPEYNGMKMKSGSIGGARAFAGYHTGKDGKEYVYAIIVNNYDGSSGEAVKKMYRVLDLLK
ncbi:D-alanyl-D-alanine carboxypeptidase/D-alanyl-D-alanine endopeptidase [Paraflavitalea speifideaquila]|uniref:D-alanyl-D-alanine carboxypeptidase/D-alanyl-D-alanine endopeptidase n=1 Tax=Paraflavitalea speifideaquila TaxID=3076558 RepID=UPI0028E9B9B9|nr:D-alanyl-D-alanine carboxypeptidase/D-alanyl-D-alanine-endopeptidase [Paraflavitalea speifideiaquila]